MFGVHEAKGGGRDTRIMARQCRFVAAKSVDGRIRGAEVDDEEFNVFDSREQSMRE